MGVRRPVTRQIIFHVGSWQESHSSRVIASDVVFMNQTEWTTDHREWYRNVYLKSDHWKELRARKIRENPTCQRCPSFAGVDVHHVNYKSLFDVEMSDLLSLCRQCHDKEHQKNGMPVRAKIDYWNYIPEPAMRKIVEQHERQVEATRKSAIPLKKVWDESDWRKFHKKHKKRWRTTNPKDWERCRVK